MHQLWKTFREFWTREEVPRWFGLSIVLIYLAGLGAVANLALRAARRESGELNRSYSTHAVELLADHLAALLAYDPPAVNPSGLTEGPSGPPAVLPRYTTRFQRILRDFAGHTQVHSLRVLDAQRKVIASTDPQEISATLSAASSQLWPPVQLESIEVVGDNAQTPGRLICMPIVAISSAEFAQSDTGTNVSPEDPAANQQPAKPSPERLYLEARLPIAAGRPVSAADSPELWLTVMVLCGALFVVYHRLRGQLRGVSRIADRLQRDSALIQQDLAGLRITDSMDLATQSWNKLVELAATLQEELRKNEANRELSSIIHRTGGQNLCDVLHALPDGIAHVASDGRFEYANATLCHLCGWDVKEVCGNVPVSQGNNGLGDHVLQVLGRAHIADVGYESAHDLIELADGSGCYRVLVIPLQSPSHAGEAVVMVRDVSQHVRADRAREEFVAQVTHELRTPLTNIRAYAETLSSGMFDDPKVITECYNVITKETRRLSRLIEDILSVSQMEVGSIELMLDNVDLKTLLTDSVRDVRGLADEKNQDLQLVLPSKMEPINADRDKLSVVLNNLLGNAIKYTSSGGSIIAGCQYKSTEVLVTIKDNGIGIDPKDHARVFEKFQRGDHPDVRKETGTGIGLYTAREIVRRHGGDINLISQPGQGTTVIVRLPHQESRASAMSVSPEVQRRG